MDMKLRTFIAMGSIAFLGVLLPGLGPGQEKKQSKDKEPAKLAEPLPLDKLLAKNQVLIPALIERLSDPDAQVRQTAAYVLANLGKDAMPSLVAALGNKDAEMRANAAYILGQLGKTAQDALPALIASMKDIIPEVRQRAAYSIQRILADSPPPQPPGPQLPPMPPAQEKQNDKPGAAGRPGVVPAGFHSPDITPPVDPGVLLPRRATPPAGPFPTQPVPVQF
jgi:hypothetical protein